MKQLLFILLTASLARGLFAEQVGNDAYLENDVVKIPVLNLGSSQYKLDLQLVPNSNPVQLKMITAEDITALNPNVSGASIFADNILTIPFLADSSASYKIELVLLSTNPSIVLNFPLTFFANRTSSSNSIFDNVLSRIQRSDASNEEGDI